MKLSKILLGSVALVAMLGMFSSCAEEEDENDMIQVSGNKATIDYTHNDSTKFSRAFETLKTDHQEANCTIVIENPTDQNYDGGMGYVFDLYEHNKKYDFGIVTVQKKKGEQILQYYVSYYKDVEGAYLTGDHSNFVVEGHGTEIMIDPKPNDTKFWNDTSITIKEGKLSCLISVHLDDSKGYDIQISDPDKTNVVSCVIPVDTRTAPEETQNKIGFYAKVATGGHLKGNWSLTDIVGNAIPIEFDEQ